MQINSHPSSPGLSNTSPHPVGGGSGTPGGVTPPLNHQWTDHDSAGSPGQGQAVHRMALQRRNSAPSGLQSQQQRRSRQVTATGSRTSTGSVSDLSETENYLAPAVNSGSEADNEQNNNGASGGDAIANTTMSASGEKKASVKPKVEVVTAPDDTHANKHAWDSLFHALVSFVKDLGKPAEELFQILRGTR